MADVSHIQNFVNVPAGSGEAREHRFHDDIAALLAPWGWSRAVGRLYAYLLHSEAPVSLDRIADDLRISKSGACSAALTLEKFGNARRYGEAGSKRVRYGPPDTLAAPLAAQSALLGTIGRLLERTGEGSPAPVADRLAAMARFYARMNAVMDATIAELDGGVVPGD